MNDLTVSILGFPAVNRDLTVELRDPVSNAVVREVKPFLDGTVRVPNITAGAYEMTVRHPNLVTPVLRRPIRVLPTGDTKVSIVLDPSQFRNTPIEDVPDANLEPVRQMTASVAETLLPLAAKQPGESIKAQDWNLMATSIRDLAQAVTELTRLVAPQGHNHPEIERKIAEMQGNFDTLVNTLSASLTELQRQFQTERFRKQVEDVLDRAAIDKDAPRGRELLSLVDDLNTTVSESPTVFNRKARNVGVQLATKIETIVAEQPDIAATDEVVALSTASEILTTSRAVSYDTELQQYRKTDRQLGAAVLRNLKR
jgi:hypothetical protein